jgi:rhodanese-related sulfurtransferase
MLDAQALKKMFNNNEVTLIDIRESDEHAREAIAGACCCPLSSLSAESVKDYDKEKPVAFHCQSGTRTKQAQQQLQALGFSKVYILEPGLSGWKKAGYETTCNKKAPLPLMRQVQIIVGFMVVLGIILSYTVSPYFNIMSAFFGAGLLFAGVSGFCGLAKVLMLLPYNKKS